MIATTAMGAWMYVQGYTEDQVRVYEAYLDASRRGREFVCVFPPPRRKTMIGYLRLTKRAWYLAGGFAEDRCVRVTRGRSWAYFWRVD